MSKDTAAIRDQLGNDPKVFPTLIPDFNEEVLIVESPIIIESTTLGNSWIVGTSTNGIVGTNTGTQNGLQQVVGAANRVTSLEVVSNPNNIFNEYFNFNTFIDTTNSTATLNTTDGKVEF